VPDARQTHNTRCATPSGRTRPSDAKPLSADTSPWRPSCGAVARAGTVRLSRPLNRWERHGVVRTEAIHLRLADIPTSGQEVLGVIGKPDAGDLARTVRDLVALIAQTGSRARASIKSQTGAANLNIMAANDELARVNHRRSRDSHQGRAT